MTEITAPYRVPVGPVPAHPPQLTEPPLSPRTRALVVGLRRALLLLCDVLGDYAGIERERATR
jgi:hypothetical protein